VDDEIRLLLAEAIVLRQHAVNLVNDGLGWPYRKLSLDLRRTISGRIFRPS